MYNSLSDNQAFGNLSYVIGGGNKDLLINILNISHADSMPESACFFMPITNNHIYTITK